MYEYDQKIWKDQIFFFITSKITHLALTKRFESKYRNCVFWDYQDNLWRKALPWVYRQSSQLFLMQYILANANFNEIYQNVLQ